MWTSAEQIIQRVTHGNGDRLCKREERGPMMTVK